MNERSQNAEHIGRLMKMSDDHLSRLIGIPKTDALKFKKEIARWMRNFTEFPSLKDALLKFRPQFLKESANHLGVKTTGVAGSVNLNPFQLGSRKKKPHVAVLNEKKSDVISAIESYKKNFKLGKLSGFRPMTDSWEKEIISIFSNVDRKYLFRAIRADKLDKSKLGIYWTYDPDSPSSYWGDESKQLYILAVTVKSSDINWVETVEQYMKPQYSESEVRLKKTAKPKLVKYFMSWEEFWDDKIFKTAKRMMNENKVIIGEGGPGSGKSYDNTLPIGMPLGEVTISKRKKYVEGKMPVHAQIKLDQIDSCGQKKYVPKKLSSMVSNWDDVKSKPIEVKANPKGKYQVLDGHHRFLAAKALGEKRIHAKIYESYKTNEAKEFQTLKGSWELVSGAKRLEGEKGKFSLSRLGIVFWTPENTRLDQLYFDFEDPDDIKPKGSEVTIKMDRNDFKFRKA